VRDKAVVQVADAGVEETERGRTGAEMSGGRGHCAAEAVAALHTVEGGACILAAHIVIIFSHHIDTFLQKHQRPNPFGLALT